MKENQPSRTAQSVAMRRAVHQVLDHPLVFEDPVALRILGEGTEAAIRADLKRYQTRPSRALRAFMAARSRFAEDELGVAIGRGVFQYVILGAGLDTFAYRQRLPELRIFEVDHPRTQNWKRSLLDAAHIAIPGNLTFVPVDFERQELSTALAGAGFHPDRPAFFSWLGVTPYLTPASFWKVVTYLTSLPPGTALVFDYAVQRSCLSLREQAALEVLSTVVAMAGEPFHLFFEPEQLRNSLLARGFSSVEDLDQHALNSRYFPGRNDGLQIMGGLGRLLSARV